MESRLTSNNENDEQKVASHTVLENTSLIRKLSDDSYLTGYKRFYELSILSVIKFFLRGEFDDEDFFIRMMNMTVSEKKVVQEWIQINFSNLEKSLESSRLLFLALVADINQEIGVYADKKLLEAAVKAGSIISITLLAQLFASDKKTKTDSYKNAISKGDKFAYFLLAELLATEGLHDEAFKTLTAGISNGSAYAHYGYATLVMGKDIDNFFHPLTTYAIVHLHIAASRGLPLALQRIAKLKVMGTPNFMDKDQEQSALFNHYAMMRTNNNFKTSPVFLLSGRYIFHVTELKNDPLALFNQNQNSLYICYQLAQAIDQIQGDENIIQNARDKFKRTFNILVKNNLQYFEALCKADELEGIEAAFAWLDRRIVRLLANKYEMVYQFFERSNLPAEVCLLIMENLIGKNLFDFLKNSLFEEEKKVEKMAQIMLHVFVTSLAEGKLGFFKNQKTYKTLITQSNNKLLSHEEQKKDKLEKPKEVLFNLWHSVAPSKLRCHDKETLLLNIKQVGKGNITSQEALAASTQNHKQKRNQGA